MPPKWAPLISKSIGYFVILMSGIFYIQRIASAPLEKVTTIALSSIGIIGVLSAICYQAVPCYDNEHNREEALYAAEKFLHSALLIIQTLFLKFAFDQILTIEFVKNTSWLKTVSSGIFIFLIVGIGSFALLFACYGFESLNRFLWNRYELRMNKMPEMKKRKKR